MNAPRNSLLTRVALNSMDLAVRHWPESSRHWGQAMLAEMGEISEPVAALNWAAGGILLFARAMMGHFLEWMRLPAGTEFSGAALPSGSNGPQSPKHSRVATVLILLGAVTLFFLPIGREAATTVKASWRGFIPSQGDRQDLEKIAVRAEKEKDARELAFVALSYPETDQAMQFADRAVDLDPSLVWIYVTRYRDRHEWSKSAKRLERLKSIDGDNAFVYLLHAYAEGEPRIESANAKRGINVESASVTLASDGEWLNEMDQAFRAPNYDSYYRRREALVREGWRKNPSLSPGLVAIVPLGQGLGNTMDAVQLLGYADLRVSQALEAGSAGNEKEGENILGELTTFGSRLATGSSDFFEHSIGIGVRKRGLEGFRKLYGANAHANKEEEIEAQLLEIKTSEGARLNSYLGWRTKVMNGLKWKAIVLQESAVLALFLGISIVVSLLVLEAGAALRWKAAGVGRLIACRVADYGPVLFLATGALLLLSFWPIAEIFEQYRSAGQFNSEGMGLFWQMFVLGDANPLIYFYQPYHQWLVATIALAVIAVIVLVRGLLKQKVVPAR